MNKLTYILGIFTIIAVTITSSFWTKSIEAYSANPNINYVPVVQPLFIPDPGSCVYSQNLLRIPHTYRQGPDGRIVIEAEELTRFLASEKAFRGEDSSCSGGRYVAYLQNGWYGIEIKQPMKLVPWYRGYFSGIGHWNHTESLDEGPSVMVTDNLTMNPNDSSLNRWSWKKGTLYEFTAGKHLFSIDWQGGAKLDQLVFLPEGIEPKEGELFNPTYNSINKTAVALTEEISVPSGQVPQKITFDTVLAGGQVKVQASTDKGKVWQPIPSDGSLERLKTEGISTLQFKLTLALSDTSASPTVYNLALETLSPRQTDLASSIPNTMLLTPEEIELVPADWTGIRSSDKGWSLALSSQPDKDGIIWLDAALADNIVLAPSQESWVTEDKSAASGKAIYQGALNRNLISFDVYVPKSTMFRPWFRIKLFRSNVFTEEGETKGAYIPFVNYQFDRQNLLFADFSKNKDFPGKEFESQQWVWLPGPDIALKEGVHTLRIRAGLEYTLLDRIALAPAASGSPAGLGGKSQKTIASSGEVTFHPLSWPIVKNLKKIIAAGDTSTGKTSYSFSVNNGKSWEPFTENSLKENNLPGQPLLLKATMSSPDGRSPIVNSWKAVFQPDASRAIVLANAEQKLLFDTETGGFMGWWSKKAGWIIPPGKVQPLFSFSIGPAGSGLTPVYPKLTDFIGPEIKTENGVTSLMLKYRMAGNMVTVLIRIDLPDEGLSRWHMEVNNQSNMDIRNLDFLRFSGLRLGPDPEKDSCTVLTTQTAPDFPGAPFQIPGGPKMYLGSTLGLGGAYPSSCSMGWLSLYNQFGGFTAQVRDKDGIITDIDFDQDPDSLGMKLGFTRKLYVGPGEKGEANYEAGWHDGDWHRAADIYSAWAHSWMDFSRVNANWARNADGWIGGGSGMGSSALPKDYLGKPIPEMEPCFIQHFGNSMDGTYSSSTFPLINPRYGTFEEFKKAHKLSHENNTFHTYYWDHRGWTEDYSDAPFIGPTPRALLPAEVTLPQRGFGEKWVVRDISGKTVPFGFTKNDLSMCPASTGWQDMLVEGIARNYVTFEGADGVYSDEAFASMDCYAEDHGHGKQHGFYDKGVQEAFRRALDIGRKTNPDMVIVIEGCPDQLMQYADFGLWVWSSYMDGVPMVYTFPEVKLLRGYNNPGGIWFRSMAEYEHSINLLLRGDFIMNRLFYAHRNRIKDWMYQSRFRDTVDLSVNRPGVIAKWFQREDGEHTGALINIQNEFAFTDATVKIKWPALLQAQYAFAYLYDEEDVVRVNLTREKDGVVVSVPGAKASSILIPAKFPGAENVRSYLLCPRDSGADRLILCLINTTDKPRKVQLSYDLPEGVTLKSPPANATLAAGEISKLELFLLRTITMAEQANIKVRIKDESQESQAGYTLTRPSLPLYNGNFEVEDTFGKKTADGWRNTSSDLFLHLVQQPTLSFDLNQTGGILDSEKPAEGRYSLRLDGSVEFPDNWAKVGRMLPWYFNTGRKLNLKPGTRYRVKFQYRCAADEGYLEVQSTRLKSHFYSNDEDTNILFSPQRIQPKPGDRNWQKFSFEFDVPANRSDCLLTFINRSTAPVWIDTVGIEDIGQAKNMKPVKLKTYLPQFDLSNRLLSANYKGAWGIYGKEIKEKELSLTRSTIEGIIEMKEFGGRVAAGIKFGETNVARWYYFRTPDWMQNSAELDLFVEYFDGGTGSVGIEYNSTNSPFTHDPKNGMIVLTGSNSWKTIRYRLRDACFTHAGNGGDFRIGPIPDGFALDAVAALLADELTTTGAKEEEEETSLPETTKSETKAQTSQTTGD